MDLEAIYGPIISELGQCVQNLLDIQLCFQIIRPVDKEISVSGLRSILQDLTTETDHVLKIFEEYERKKREESKANESGVSSASHMPMPGTNSATIDEIHTLISHSNSEESLVPSNLDSEGASILSNMVSFYTKKNRSEMSTSSTEIDNEIQLVDEKDKKSLETEEIMSKVFGKSRKFSSTSSNDRIQNKMDTKEESLGLGKVTTPSELSSQKPLDEVEIVITRSSGLLKPNSQESYMNVNKMRKLKQKNKKRRITPEKRIINAHKALEKVVGNLEKIDMKLGKLEIAKSTEMKRRPNTSSPTTTTFISEGTNTSPLKYKRKIIKRRIFDETEVDQLEKITGLRSGTERENFRFKHDQKHKKFPKNEEKFGSSVENTEYKSDEDAGVESETTTSKGIFSIVNPIYDKLTAPRSYKVIDMSKCSNGLCEAFNHKSRVLSLLKAIPHDKFLEIFSPKKASSKHFQHPTHSSNKSKEYQDSVSWITVEDKLLDVLLQNKDCNRKIWKSIAHHVDISELTRRVAMLRSAHPCQCTINSFL